ncbi:leucyl aminopeptidase [Methylobrevis albus]|uniref:Probable cytosol aminopeptidase n=1 Tax=Methylobrevis albus TaxID=2793297 RepID=A0A931I4E7_9HYPH|nr:leucyl aminopeptidase [Methylobrevis albus]MBH0239697.1 leucyl aminopeptidase [Methylobrevis albus]
MSQTPTIAIAKPSIPATGIAVVFTDGEGTFGPLGTQLADASAGGLARAIKAADFKGKAQSVLDIVAPAGLELDRLLVVGVGKTEEFDTDAALKLGGVVAGKLKDLRAETVTVLFEVPGIAEPSVELVADFGLGFRLRLYEWDKHKTKKKDDPAPKMKVTIATDVPKAKKAYAEAEEVAAGVELARDLVNEAPNVLGPVEFAKIAEDLSSVGLEVEVLTDKDMKKLGMGALLGVAQGSVRPARLAIMTWNGGKPKDAPLAFVGKGVVFDTGGISIKPASGMEDMKGDMGGAAAVTGLMRALAGRKAKVNAIGVIGLVENMPDGNAYRPGDILTSMSGQTIEVINTDAEGRLVLADALWYTQDRFKPAFMINLATLTGAVMVALGTQHAGLFSNDDTLADNLYKAGQATGEKLWRLPMGPDYDKQIDSRFADMKNTGGRYGGSITAAQFLKRFVNDCPWAHLDVAGTAMASADTEINRSWGSGYGVRLLDRLVRDVYES